MKKTHSRAHSYTFGDNNVEIPMAAYTTFLNELQRFVLQNSEALQLYRKFLQESARPSLVNHIDFYQDLLTIEKTQKHSKVERGDHPLTYLNIYTKYFSGNDPQHMLDIKPEIIMEVRENVCKIVSSAAFKAAVYAVIKDLCFESLTNFTNSDLFQECKVFLRTPANTTEMLNLPPKERDTAVRLRKFFGEQLQTKDAGRLSFRSQPRHVKSYRLNKRFGERVLLEHTESDTASSGGESPRSPRSVDWRRSRRLHVFFGDSFIVDEVLLSEKLRAPGSSVDEDSKSDTPKEQPDHVNPHRLNRFFGERVNVDIPHRHGPVANDETGAEDIMDTGDMDATGHAADSEAPDFINSRFAKNQRIIRFFGERMDPLKEAAYKMFAGQPANVTPLKLKKIFGTPDVAAAVDNNELPQSPDCPIDSPTKKAKRAHKLHKFFGTKVEDDVACLNLEEEVDHVVPSM